MVSIGLNCYGVRRHFDLNGTSVRDGESSLSIQIVTDDIIELISIAGHLLGDARHRNAGCGKSSDCRARRRLAGNVDPLRK